MSGIVQKTEENRDKRRWEQQVRDKAVDRRLYSRGSKYDDCAGTVRVLSWQESVNWCELLPEE